MEDGGGAREQKQGMPTISSSHGFLFYVNRRVFLYFHDYPLIKVPSFPPSSSPSPSFSPSSRHYFSLFFRLVTSWDKGNWSLDKVAFVSSIDRLQAI